MCSVHVQRYSRGAGKFQAQEKLIPACQHEVAAGIIITTWKGGGQGEDSDKYAGKVTKSIRLLTELLVAENLQPQEKKDVRGVNELQAIADRLNVKEVRPGVARRVDRDQELHGKSRYYGKPINLEQLTIEYEPSREKDPSRARKEQEAVANPYSARSIIVDHDRCILCDRCARSCSDVKPFKIIGHTGKGYRTRVSFDLDAIMNDSNCVQCGECMTTCPTGALTLRRRVAPMIYDEKGRAITDGMTERSIIPADVATPLPEGYGFLTAEEMQRLTLNYKGKPFQPFATIPFAFLKWNEGAVRRREVKPGDVLCRVDDYGSTAFLIESGTFKLRVRKGKKREAPKPGFLGRLFGVDPEKHRAEEVEIPVTITADNLIVGELAALSAQQRTATIVAATPGVVYEITRNILDMAQRSPSARGVFGEVYTANAIATCLRNTESEKSLFKDLSPEDRKTATVLLNDPQHATLFRYEPGQKIIREGDIVIPRGEGEPADPKKPDNDWFYIIRRGFVKVATSRSGAEKIFNWYSSENHFGEIAYLSGHPLVAAELARQKRTVDPGIRTADVVALDPVEVIRIPGWLFRKLLNDHPAIYDKLAERAVEILKPKAIPATTGEYLNQGVFQGQKMLVLDLKNCTRCDECTRACADGHGDGVSRLLREGLRFGDFLVTTSCRSCHKPYCMDGCPVDAIHRKGTHLEVQIDKHCIGCGLCENNCPYGAIQLVPKVAGHAERGMTAKVEKRAVNCDLCHDLIPAGGETYCVAACPHDAAFRWDGETVHQEVARREVVRAV
jgi:Fe-S-cluster-containing dehydrogenase component/CRP-like cAMP-binding protein